MDSKPSLTEGAPNQLGIAPGTETSMHFPSCIEKNLSSQGLIVPGHPSPQSITVMSRSLLDSQICIQILLTSPLVVHHPAIGVHLGGAPGLARVAVDVRAGGVGHVAVDEGEHTGHPAAAHRPAGLWTNDIITLQTAAHCRTHCMS